ncbi:MAG: hypothetical protein JSR64_20000 [Nitrospira sp.]|nr:hypothetical protein [Nitrospira sp.]
MTTGVVEFPQRQYPVGSSVWVRGAGAGEVVAAHGEERTVRFMERTPAGWVVRVADLGVDALRPLLDYTGGIG